MAAGQDGGSPATASPGITTEVRQVPERDLAAHVNDLKSVRNLVYFGHGYSRAPLYDQSTGFNFPEGRCVLGQALLAERRAIFATCNSWKYAAQFTEETGVTSTGVQGTTYFGSTEISAGRLTDDANAGTSVAFTYQDTDAGVVSSGPTSLNQRNGTPFLRLQNVVKPQPAHAPRSVPVAPPR